jgi:uncharacterized protein (UPF0548 family)
VSGRAARQTEGVSPPQLDQAARTRLEAAALTYGAGIRADASAPHGYWRLDESRGLGSGDAVFQRACDELFSWRMHERAGFLVQTSGAEIRVGLVLTLSTRRGPMRVLAPCRVVRVTRDDDRAGFTYGTLPGHPVSGQEEFLIQKQSDDQVVATIRAVSRPYSTLAKLGAPITRWQQKRIASLYLSALADVR